MPKGRLLEDACSKPKKEPRKRSPLGLTSIAGSSYPARASNKHNTKPQSKTLQPPERNQLLHAALRDSQTLAAPAAPPWAARAVGPPQGAWHQQPALLWARGQCLPTPIGASDHYACVGLQTGDTAHRCWACCPSCELQPHGVGRGQGGALRFPLFSFRIRIR